MVYAASGNVAAGLTGLRLSSQRVVAPRCERTETFAHTIRPADLHMSRARVGTEAEQDLLAVR